MFWTRSKRIENTPPTPHVPDIRRLSELTERGSFLNFSSISLLGKSLSKEQREEADSFWNTLYYAYNQLDYAVIIIELKPKQKKLRICYTNQAAQDFFSVTKPIDLWGCPITDFMPKRSREAYENIIHEWRASKTSAKNGLHIERPHQHAYEFILNGHKVTASLSFGAAKGKVVNVLLITKCALIQSTILDRMSASLQRSALINLGCGFYRQISQDIHPSLIKEKQRAEQQEQENDDVLWSNIHLAYSFLQEAVIVVEVLLDQTKRICYANQSAQDFLSGYNVDYDLITRPEGLHGRMITEIMSEESQTIYERAVNEWQEARTSVSVNKSKLCSSKCSKHRAIQCELIMQEQQVTASLTFFVIKNKIMNIFVIKACKPIMTLEGKCSPNVRSKVASPKESSFAWGDMEYNGRFFTQHRSALISQVYPYGLSGESDACADDNPLPDESTIPTTIFFKLDSAV